MSTLGEPKGALRVYQGYPRSSSGAHREPFGRSWGASIPQNLVWVVVTVDECGESEDGMKGVCGEEEDEGIFLCIS